jgi:hypothetical protein
MNPEAEKQEEEREEEEKKTVARAVRERRIAEKEAQNIATVLQHGPAIRGNTSFMEAKCRTGNHVELGGLGGMGVGAMWVPATPRHKQDPDWQLLPIRSCVGQFLPAGSEDCGTKEERARVESQYAYFDRLSSERFLMKQSAQQQQVQQQQQPQ